MSFRFKPFQEMTADDYAAIGFRCGLEVHQQLRTRRKLFCHCPVGGYSDAYEAEVLRHMRPTLSELGEYDGTALMEKKTRKNIYYRIHPDTVCTYEFDDTPPFFPDEHALDIALEIALLLDLNVVGEMHIARKQYLDGSIPTGFQRTAIIGVGGSLPFDKDRRIGIRQLSLEEDSCREVSDIGHDRVYLTDRLGMPLIETVTEPDMGTPQEAAEVCQIIRLLCRSTGKVRTGYGAARQDVNVSVRGGTRVEIKGVPQITRMPLLVYNEAMRQCALLHIRELLKERGITSESFRWSSFDVTPAMAKTHYPPIRDGLARGDRVRCVVLRGFAGLLSHQTQEQTTFAKEFSDRVRVIACLTTLPNIVHSDTAADLLTVRVWKELRRRTKAGERDALVLVWGDEADVRTAGEEIAARALEATEGVPSDTRQALKDGTTGFERVLPGAERMYPDTDLPPMSIAVERVQRIRSGLPERVWDRLARYRELGLPEDVIQPLGVSPRSVLFDRLVNELGMDPVFASVVLVQRFKAWQRRGLLPGRIGDDDVLEVFAACKSGRLTREGVIAVLRRAVPSAQDGPEGNIDICGIIDDVVARAMSIDELPDHITNSVADLDRRAFRTPAARHRFVMGRLRRAGGGVLDGPRVATRVKEALEGHLAPRRPTKTAT